MNNELDNNINKIEIADGEVAVVEEEAAKRKIEPKFKVISIEKTATPDGMVGDDWHQYIIGQGTAKIEGLKAGTLKEVTLHAEVFAEDLNGRSKGGNAGYVSRKQKPIPPTPPAPATTTS